jgi:hypothetical protein
MQLNLIKQLKSEVFLVVEFFGKIGESRSATTILEREERTYCT